MIYICPITIFLLKHEILTSLFIKICFDNVLMFFYTIFFFTYFRKKASYSIEFNLSVRFSNTLGCFSTTRLRSSKVNLPFRSFPAASNMTSVRSLRWSSPRKSELSSIQVVRIVFNSSRSMSPEPDGEITEGLKPGIYQYHLRGRYSAPFPIENRLNFPQFAGKSFQI